MIAVLSTAPATRETRRTATPPPSSHSPTPSHPHGPSHAPGLGPALDQDAEARAWVAAFAEGWRAPAGPDAFIAHFRPLLASDVRLIQPQLPDVHGRDGFEREFVRPLFELIPDARADVQRWSARDGDLHIELTLHGTVGRRPVSWRVCDRVTLRDGVATERESYFDPTPLLAAVARAPRVWPRFARLRLRGLARRLNRRTP
jgi:hypothetical protein